MNEKIYLFSSDQTVKQETAPTFMYHQHPLDKSKVMNRDICKV